MIPKYISNEPIDLILSDKNQIHNPLLEIKEFNQRIDIIYSKKITDKTVILITSDFKDHIVIHFEKESLCKLEVIFFSQKNSSYRITYDLEDGANVLVHEILLSSKQITSNVIEEYAINQNALLTLSKGIFASGVHSLEENILLNGQNASVNYESLCIGSSDDEYNIVQNFKHQAKNTTSLIQNMIVSNDVSEISYYVNGYIDKGMSGSNSKQQNKGVLLSKLGAIRVDPKLFINEYDVEAGHGAAIGQIDEDEIFYLLSRGLKEEEAKRLILSGYTDAFISHFDEGSLKNYIERKITNKIKGNTNHETK